MQVSGNSKAVLSGNVSVTVVGHFWCTFCVVGALLRFALLLFVQTLIVTFGELAGTQKNGKHTHQLKQSWTKLILLKVFVRSPTTNLINNKLWNCAILGILFCCCVQTVCACAYFACQSKCPFPAAYFIEVTRAKAHTQSETLHKHQTCPDKPVKLAKTMQNSEQSSSSSRSSEYVNNHRHCCYW